MSLYFFKYRGSMIVVPTKNNFNLPEYANQLHTLTNFHQFVLGINPATSRFKEDACKVIDCLKFIKINLDFIGYAVEHRDDSSIYTFEADKPKGVIRDFNHTSLHFNSYHSAESVQCGLKYLVNQFEQAIEAMQERGALEAFARKLQFDGDVGCIEARTAAALSFAATQLSYAPPNLDDLMETCQQQFASEDEDVVILAKTMNFFKLRMDQVCLWNNKEYVINSALIKRYLIEVLAFNALPIETLLEELKTKGAIPHHSVLIDNIDPVQLNRALLADLQEGLVVLQAVIRNLLPDSSTKFIHKIDTKTIKKLISQENKGYISQILPELKDLKELRRPWELPKKNKALISQIKLLQSVLKTQSPTLLEGLLDKLDIEFSADTDKWFIFWKNFIYFGFTVGIVHAGSLFLRALICAGIAATAIILLCLLTPAIITLPFFLYLVISVLCSVILVPILLSSTSLAIIYPVIGLGYFIIGQGTWIVRTIIETRQHNQLYKTILSDIIAFKSVRLLGLFLSRLSPKQLKKIDFPFELSHVPTCLPALLFASDFSSKSSNVYNIFYNYCYTNSMLRNILTHNKHGVLTRCVDDYFEGKGNRPHEKIIALFEECLAKKQSLSNKEQAFLEHIKQENSIFPEKNRDEIWQKGVASWGQYRYLRQQNNSLMEDVLNQLLAENKLFTGAETSQAFDQGKAYQLTLEKKDRQAFEEAEACIQSNKALVKVIRPEYWKLFMRQLEDLNHRESSLRQSVNEGTHNMKKFVHLTGEIIPYHKKRRCKLEHTHTKKTSTTLLSRNLNTPLFGQLYSEHTLVGLLFNQRQCVVKARLLHDFGTHSHLWVGKEGTVNSYKAVMQEINQIDEKQFIEITKDNAQTNEVLAKLNKEALQAVVIGQDTLEARREAVKYRDEIKSKFSKNLPIIFYNSSSRKIQPYTQAEQANDETRTEQSSQSRSPR